MSLISRLLPVSCLLQSRREAYDLKRIPGNGGEPPAPGQSTPPDPAGTLDRALCQVGGLNQNYTSSSGTLYHVQIEDRGPVMDRVSEREVRRVNVIVYSNYGEANAQIIHGRDHDFPDLRTREHNHFVEQAIQRLAAEARTIVEEKERRLVARIKVAIHDYYLTKDEAAKREFEAANAAYPFLFSRAWMELKRERAAGEAVSDLAAELAAEAALDGPGTEESVEEVLYPLDPDLRERVLEIERVIIELGQDLQRLRAQGGADDILVQTCRKLVARAKESLTGREASEFNARRLDMTRNSLLTTWRQVRSRFRS